MMIFDDSEQEGIYNAKEPRKKLLEKLNELGRNELNNKLGDLKEKIESAIFR